MLLRPLLLLAAFFVLPGPLLAWNRAGHMVSGAIAYDDLLQRHPRALARAVALLQQHPQHEDWAGRFAFLPAEEHDRALFMKAARWADDVRGQPRFHPRAMDPWHYINFPFKPEGEPEEVKPAEPAAVNILTAFEANLKELRDPTLDPGRRAVALCWLYHLAGDVHQPLHVVSLFRRDFPQGDRGGTRFYIRATPQAKSTISLHAFWDDLILGSDKYQTVKNRAIFHRLNEPRAKVLNGKKTGIRAWADESLELARTHAYDHGKLAGSRGAADGTPLPAGYAARVQPLAYRRIAQAGYRLSDLLAEVFADGK